MTPRGRLGVLHQLANRPPPPASGERCDMCAEAIAGSHQHVVNLEGRTLMCTCRGCYLLFTDQSGRPAVTGRSPTTTCRSTTSAWVPPSGTRPEIPVGLAFLFRNSVLDRTIAFYPGPAGVIESELSLAAWDTIVEANPRLRILAPDVEALLVRAPDRGRTTFDCHLVPIDACYEAGRPAAAGLAGLRRRPRRACGAGRLLRRRRRAQPRRAESAHRGTSMSELSFTVRDIVVEPYAAGAATDRETAADRGERRKRYPRDRAALPGAVRAAATRLRAG